MGRTRLIALGALAATLGLTRADEPRSGKIEDPARVGRPGERAERTGRSAARPSGHGS